MSKTGVRKLLRHTTVLSTKGQVVVPADVRRDLSWEPGLTLLIRWSRAENRLILEPIDRSRRPTAIPAAGSLRDVYPASAEYVRSLRDEAERPPWR